MADFSKVTIFDATFVSEARELSQFPAAGAPEVAIAGRSNVGKSTLLNSITNRNGLARVSKTPGRTRGLVMFDITIRFAPGEERQAIRLVDLPGYGYAKGPKEDRLSWKTLVEGYVRSREALKTMLLLVDARRDLGEEEVQLCDWLAAEGLPCHVVITKSDKLGATERGLLVKARKEALRGRVSSVSMVSALKSEGIEEVWKKIAYDLRATP